MNQNSIKNFFYSKYFYTIIAVLIITIGALYLFWPMLFGKYLFPQKFIGLFHYMYFTVMEYFVYGLGMLPNWWHAYDSGYPINLTLDGFLNPIFILSLKYLPPFLANNLMVFIFFVINAVSLYALGLALKLSRSGSLIAAISYGFSGVMIAYGDVTGIIAVLPFLPLSFLCCLKIFQGKIKWFWFWLLLLVYSWIGGWSETVVYALAAVSFFAIYLIIKNRNREEFKYYYPLLFFGAIFISVVILSPWFLSLLHFVSYSQRGQGIDIGGAANMPTTLSHLIHMINPRISVFYGESLPFIALGDYDFFLFIGILPLLLVISALFIKDKKEKGYLVFFFFLALGAILMTIKNSPLFWFFHQIPVLKWFQGYWKWSFVIVFSLAILAGYGIDNIRDFFKNRFAKHAIIALWVLMIIAILGISAITVFDQKIKTAIASYGIARYKNTPDKVFQRSEAYYHHIIEKMSESLVSSFSFKNKIVILIMILWLISLSCFTLVKYQIIPHQKWKMLAVIITLLGSVLVWTDFLNGTPVSYLKSEPETAKYIHLIDSYRSNKLPIDKNSSKELEPFRIFLYTPDQFISILSEKYGVDLAEYNNRLLLNREMMDDNMHIMFDFDTFYNHQTLASQRLLDMYYLARQQSILAKSYADKNPFDQYLNDFSSEKNMELLGMLNIKYILTPFELENNLNPIFTTHIIDNKLPVYIYQNPYFMPRWYFSNNIKWSHGTNEKILEDLMAIDNFRQTTLLEPLNANDLKIITKPEPDDSFELQLYTAGKLQMKTKTKNYRFLVFNESRIPFWQATINGNPAALYTANYLYQAVLAPPGENIIEFRYPNLWEQGIFALKSRIQPLR